MSSPTTNKILIDNVTALHKAKKAYVASKSIKKIHRVLNHNVRTSGEIKYITCDSVYFNHVSERWCRGPGDVLGQDGQQVLVKYGSSYVRIHPRRLALECNHDKTDNVSPTLIPNGSIQEQTKERHCRTFDEDSDEEPESQEEQNNNRKMNTLSNSMKRLSMSQPIEWPPILTEKKDILVK